MKMTVEAKASKRVGDEVHINVRVTYDSVDSDLIPLFYSSMLKGMRDASTRDFYHALALFSEDDMDDMIDFFEGGENDD